MTARGCTGCHRPVKHGYLCGRCTGELRALYRRLPDLIADLAITAYRQDRLAVPGGGKVGKGHVRPLPFKPPAAELLRQVQRHLLDRADRSKIAFAAPRRLCVLLGQSLAADVAHDALIGADFNRLADDAEAMQAMIDKPEVYRYLGQCDECGSGLYAPRDVAEHACPGTDCTRRYDVASRIADLIERSRDVVAPPATIATALTSLDWPVTEELIWKWRQRGLLTPRATVGRHTHYRLGDVLDLLERQRVKRYREVTRTARGA